MCCAVFSCSVVSNSLWPHGLQASRLLCPWRFSRKEYWSGFPCPPPGDFPNPGIEPRSPTCRPIPYWLCHQGSPIKSMGSTKCWWGCGGTEILSKMVQPLWITIPRKVKRTVIISSVQSLSRIRLFVTPWITARQTSLSITNSRSSLRLTSIESVRPSSHLILCRPLLLLPPMPPSIRVFSNESTLCMRWPK